MEKGSLINETQKPKKKRKGRFKQEIEKEKRNALLTKARGEERPSDWASNMMLLPWAVASSGPLGLDGSK